MFDAQKNFEQSKKLVGYKKLHETLLANYEKLGFKCGLEVHQQLLTDKKLFCRCPAGRYQKPGEFSAEVIRHMRPTLSELGEYDGTALMEFRTRKNIIYRIKYETACTYDIDDTPPFRINQDALNIAVEIALLFKENIVGEFHIARKQYLDGSIPTGFQRTGIVGVAGEFPIKNKTIRLIQMSIEEDACREVSDVGHWRTYTTDRLGMPLIEVVTHADMKTPFEAAEAGQMIRFMTRSTGKVRTGNGAGREDVNVSVTGGQRVEIKGVPSIALIPKLTHNEAYRQRSLLLIKEELAKRVVSPKDWHVSHIKLLETDLKLRFQNLSNAAETLNPLNRGNVLIVNLPQFKGLLSFFTQPGRTFADEISDRLKVIACLEKPNIITSEDVDRISTAQLFEPLKQDLKANTSDAQILFYAPDADIKTAIETIEERCKLAFTGVPNETRKPKKDGTTLFERVLPGPDRMYPDTDSAPIPITETQVTTLQKNLPNPVSNEIKQLNEWTAPPDTFAYLLRHNLMQLVRRIVTEFAANPVFVVSVFGHTLKHVQGQITSSAEFDYKKIYGLFKFVSERKLKPEIIRVMLPVVYEHPNIEFDSVLELINFKPVLATDIKHDLPFLYKKFQQIKISKRPDAWVDWMMGQVRKAALGSLSLNEVRQMIVEVAP